jgi:uncharacterized membrane protein YcgQ (UPF0703/DUF1980 family)
MNKIDKLKELEALISNTYMYAIIIAIVALVIAYIAVNLIKYRGGKHSNDHIKRRVWYIIIGIFTAISFFMYNNLIVSSSIAKAPLQAKFSTANILATLSVLGIYGIVGIVTMLIMRSSKWGSILGKTKK